MKIPNGRDLLAKLIELYAGQEGVRVNYKIETKEKGERDGKI